MKICKAKNNIQRNNSTHCTVIEIPIDTHSLNMALTEINGRYPETGYALLIFYLVQTSSIAALTLTLFLFVLPCRLGLVQMRQNILKAELGIQQKQSKYNKEDRYDHRNRQYYFKTNHTI